MRSTAVLCKQMGKGRNSPRYRHDIDDSAYLRRYNRLPVGCVRLLICRRDKTILPRHYLYTLYSLVYVITNCRCQPSISQVTETEAVTVMVSGSPRISNGSTVFFGGNIFLYPPLRLSCLVSPFNPECLAPYSSGSE